MVKGSRANRFLSTGALGLHVGSFLHTSHSGQHPGHPVRHTTVLGWLQRNTWVEKTSCLREFYPLRNIDQHHTPPNLTAGHLRGQPGTSALGSLTYPCKNLNMLQWPPVG